MRRFRAEEQVQYSLPLSGKSLRVAQNSVSLLLQTEVQGCSVEQILTVEQAAVSVYQLLRNRLIWGRPFLSCKMAVMSEALQ